MTRADMELLDGGGRPAPEPALGTQSLPAAAGQHR
jgi:hypothetical protein